MTGNARPAGCHRRCQGRYAQAHQAHGPSGMRRRGLRQDRGGAARGVQARGRQIASRSWCSARLPFWRSSISRTFKDRFAPFGVERRGAQPFSHARAAGRVRLRAFAEGSDRCARGHAPSAFARCEPHEPGPGDHRRGAALRRAATRSSSRTCASSIDVLTLSATPIPRTMQMSLSGVRDMSLILTPPDDRRPVERARRRVGPRRGERRHSGASLPEAGRCTTCPTASGPSRTQWRRVHGGRRARRAWAWRTGRWTKDALEKVMEEFSRRAARCAGGHHHHRVRHRQPAHATRSSSRIRSVWAWRRCTS